MAEAPKEKAKRLFPEKSKKRKLEQDRGRAQTGINLGVAFSRWRDVRQERDYKSDADVAFFLLDYYEKYSSLTKSSPPGDKGDDLTKKPLCEVEDDGRTPSMEVVVGIDEDNLSQLTDSDTEQADNGLEDPGDVSEDEETSEDNSYNDDSNDEDYQPPFYIQFDGTYKKNRCPNPVQSTSKKDTLHDAEDAETAEQPAVVDKVPSQNENSHTGSSPRLQIENQESDGAENLHLDEEDSEKTCLEKKPSCPSGTDTEPASSKLEAIPPLPDNPASNKMNTKRLADLNHHEKRKPELQDRHCISAPTQRQKKRYICLTCGKEFPRNPALKRHLVIHSGERPFKCFICGRGFTQGGNLKTHMKVHKGELHKWTLVEEKKPVEEPPVTAHICGECGMDFPEKQQLDEHRETHKKPFECLVCGKTFKWGVSLEIHQRLHSEDTPYRCSVCGKVCGTAQTLQKHEAIHTGKKNFHCNECGKSFLHENYLKIHLKTHTGERPHLCSICGKSYSRAGILREHLRVHTGEKPYTCGKCGKGFRYAQTFQKHWLTHDKKPKPPTRPLGRPKQQVLEGNNQ